MYRKNIVTLERSTLEIADMETPYGQCFYCSVNSATRCQCGQYYCSEDHLKIHRPGQYCLPFKVTYSPQVGRYLVASRDIKPLELVLWDTAAAVGPAADSVPVCLECFSKVDGTFQCPNCQVMVGAIKNL